MFLRNSVPFCPQYPLGLPLLLSGLPPLFTRSAQLRVPHPRRLDRIIKSIKRPIKSAVIHLPKDIMLLSFPVTTDLLKLLVVTAKNEFNLETRPAQAPHLSTLLRTPTRIPLLSVVPLQPICSRQGADRHQ